MTAERRSRAEITKDSHGAIVLTLYCEETKKIMPFVGFQYEAALVVANTLVQIHAAGLSLPEVVYDLTQAIPG